jgi:hypothetical protein
MRFGLCTFARNIWFMVYGLWFMVYGLWFMVYGFWFLVSGFWFGYDEFIQTYGFWYQLLKKDDLTKSIRNLAPGTFSLKDVNFIR